MSLFAKRFWSRPRLRVMLGLILCFVALGCPFLRRGFRSGASTEPLRVGIDNAPPYQMFSPGGPVEGLSVDMIGEAAKRRGIPIVFVPIQGLLPDEALRSGVVDLW